MRAISGHNDSLANESAADVTHLREMRNRLNETPFRISL